MSSNTTPKKKNKRKRASEGTPPDKAGKKLKDKSECITCHICEDPILEPTDHFEGQDAVFCEGICNSWLHRKCVGLSQHKRSGHKWSGGTIYDSIDGPAGPLMSS